MQWKHYRKHRVRSRCRWIIKRSRAARGLGLFAQPRAHMASTEILTATVGTSRGIPFPLSYQLHGNGAEKLLLIMGLGVTGSAWQWTVAGLLSKNQNLQICTYDNRGVGQSGNPPQRYTTSEMARDGIDLLQHLGWNRAHIVGVSLGGMIAQELVLAWGFEHVQSLGLIVTHTGRVLAPWAGTVGMFKLITAKTPEEAAPHVINMLYTQRFLDTRDERTGKTNREIMTERYVTRKKTEPKSQNEWGHFQAASTHHVSNERLSALRTAPFPTLVIGATEDHLVAGKHSETIRDIIRPAEFIMFESGHHVVLEKFDEFNAAILRNVARSSTYTSPPSAAVAKQ